MKFRRMAALLRQPKTIFVGILIAGAAGLGLGVGIPLLAAPPTAPTIEQRIYVKADGTAPFDSTTWDGVNNSATHGTDASANNAVVRAQDSITYSMEFSINELNATNVVGTATLIGGQTWVKLPAQCLTTDVTPASSISTDSKTLVCNAGSQSQGSKLVIYADAYVGTARNGENVSASLSVDSDQTSPLPLSHTENVLVTAIFAIDVANVFSKTSSGAVNYTYDVKNQSNNNGIVANNIITIRLSKGSELPSGNSHLSLSVCRNTVLA